VLAVNEKRSAKIAQKLTKTANKMKSECEICKKSTKSQKFLYAKIFIFMHF